MMLAIFPVLMRIISFTLHKTMIMMVYNQHPDIELVSPTYFCNRGTYNEYPVEKTDAGTMIKIGFRFGLNKLSEGVLMYEVRGKGNTKFDQQPSADTMSTEVVEDTSEIMRLLVAWKIERPRELGVRIVLVEHDNRLVLNEDKLAELYGKVNDLPSEYYGHSWLVCNNTVLEVAYETVQEYGFGLKISISKGVEDMETLLVLLFNR
jgi:hypothetical protein